MTAVRLARASAEDISFIMETERLDGYDRWVGRWDEARHRQALVDPRYAVFVGIATSGERFGFAILRDWAAAERVSLVQRVAVREPGRGMGRALVAAVVDAVFCETDIHRLVIGCFPENARAVRAYEAVGFVREGVARGSAFFFGEHRDELVLAMLRPEWRARRLGSA